MKKKAGAVKHQKDLADLRAELNKNKLIKQNEVYTKGTAKLKAVWNSKTNKYDFIEVK